MKQYSILFALAFIFCASSKAQNLNDEFTKEGKAPYLIGKINKKGLQGENYNAWFTKNHDAYQPTLEIVNAIASKLKDYEIKLFMGTWCGDSKRQVPKFYKVLEACNFPMEQLTAIAVSREPDLYKQSPKHEEEGFNIVRVPTFIFFKDGEEVNRIIERPIETIEKDIEQILTTNTYKSNYFGVKKEAKIAKKSTP